jgi:hypothetical protein
MKNKKYKPSIDILPSIERTRVIDGKAVPAFINNYHHFYVNLEVYADGAVDCWELTDLKIFIEKLQQGWVTPQIPDGETISVHGLGEWKVSKGKWIFDSKKFYEYVVSIVKELNPTTQNIFTYEEKKVNGITLGSRADGNIYREEKGDWLLPERIKGHILHAFLRTDSDKVSLINLIIFKDGKVLISGLAEPLTTDLNSLEELVEQHKVVSEISRNTEVTVYGLGSFIAEHGRATPIKEKLLEAHDIHAQLNGKPTSIQKCTEAYKHYLATPTIANRDSLREEYEKVPLHTRRFVGDQDTGDIPVRMIIYGDQEIEKWSHYIASQEKGIELPKIVVPRPIDE